MKKSGFIIGCISMLLGAITLIITSILQELFPKIGYLTFQSAMLGSYSQSDYIMDFSATNLTAAIIIVAGLALSAYCFISDRKSA